MSEYVSKINEIIEKTTLLLEFKLRYLESWKKGLISFKIKKGNGTNIRITSPLSIKYITNLVKDLFVRPDSLRNKYKESNNDWWKITNIKSHFVVELDKRTENWSEEGYLILKEENKEIIDEEIKRTYKTIKDLDGLKSDFSNVPLIQEILFHSEKRKEEQVIGTNGIEKKITEEITLDTKQIKFLEQVLETSNKLSICTGAAGTGKTTTASSLIRHLIKRKKRCIVASETNASIDSLFEKVMNSIKSEQETIFPLCIKGKKTRVSEKIKAFSLDDPNHKFLSGIIEPLDEFYKNHSKQYKNTPKIIQLQKEWLKSLKNKQIEFPTWYLQFFNLVFCTFDIAKTLPFYSKNKNIKNKNIIIPIPFDSLIIDNGETIPLVDLLQVTALSKRITIFGDLSQKIENKYKTFFNTTVKIALKTHGTYTDEELLDLFSSIVQKESNKQIKRETLKKENLDNESKKFTQRLNESLKKIQKKIRERNNQFESELGLSALEITEIIENTIASKVKLDNIYRNPLISPILDGSYCDSKEEKSSNTKIDIIFDSIKISNPFYLFDTNKIKVLRTSYGSKKKTSKKNEKEGEILVKILSKLKIDGKRNVDIAILTPYRAQLEEVFIPKISGWSGKEFKKNELCIFEKGKVRFHVETFDSFANSECDIAIITFTIAGKNEITQFLSKKERIYNVLSRARHLCLFIAKKDILEEILNKTGFHCVWKYIDNQKSKQELPYDYIK